MLAKLYQDVLSGTGTKNSNERIYAAQQLAKLPGLPVMQDELEWKSKILSSIVGHTLFEMKQTYGPIKSIPTPLSEDAKKKTKEIFLRAVDIKAKTFEDMCLVLTKTLNFTDHLLKNKPIAVPLYAFNKDTHKSWTKIVNTVNELGSTERNKEKMVFQLLFTHMAFQLFFDPEGTHDIMEDLYICLEESRKSSKSNYNNEEEKPKWVEVLVDALLSLMSQNKHVLRQVVKSVMSLLCPHMTVNALQAVLDVVNPQEDKNESEMQSEDGSIEDADMSDENETIDEDMNASDAEENGQSSSDESDDGGEETENVDDDFRDRVKEALGEAKEDSDEEDGNASIDMDDLDDEAMEKMDENLGKLFKQLSGKKSKGQLKSERKDVTAQMHFKIRCLDIIDVYLNHQPSMSHVLFLISPLLECMDSYIKMKDHGALTTRLKSTLKKITSLKKIEEADSELDPSSIPEILQSLMDFSNTSSTLVAELSQPLPIFAQCCTMVLKCCQKLKDSEVEQKVLGIYRTAMDSFFDKA